MREVNAILGKEIFLGRCGENKATCVSFNISDWQRTYGDGTPYVLHQRNGDKQPYPCDIEVNGNTVTWCITNSDVAVAGRGRVELQYFKDDTLVKSETFTTVTERALGVASETPPEPYESWMETMLEKATDAQECARLAAEAEASANAAAKSESNAKASEIAAANSASATALDVITVKSNTEITYEYMAAARDYMAEADGSRKAAADAALEAQAHANSIVGDKEAAAASAASAKASASEATTSKTEAAASAARAEIAAIDAARDAAAEVEKELADHVAAAERAEELARNSANESVLNQQAAQTHARTASNHADRAIEAANDALDAQSAAEKAQAAAEAAAKNAEQQAGGEFATPAYVDSKVAESEYNVCQYVDLKIANVPTPDVSGQIDAHDADSEAHADIRQAVANAESNANKYTDQKIAAIPTPDVSGQIATHNAATDAHADIRQMAESAGTLAASAQADATNALRDADYAWREAMGKASIFYCYSDSTTLDEIDEQVENGNIIILDEAGRYVPMVSGEYGTSYLFRGAVDDATIISASIDYDGWTVFEKSIMPEDHASDEDTYGLGSGIYYGHVKLSDSVSSTDSSSTGTAASPVAVKTAYDKAVSAQTAANNAATAASTAQTAATNAQNAANSKAPMYTYGTDDLEAGVTVLETGKLHFVYE